MDVIARLPRCAGQAADAVSAYTQEQWKMLQIIENSQIGMSRYLDLYVHPLAGLLWRKAI